MPATSPTTSSATWTSSPRRAERNSVMQHHPVAAEVAALVAGRDPQRLASALTETARLRALLPGGPIQADGRADVAACFHGFFADFDTVQLVDAAGEPV